MATPPGEGRSERQRIVEVVLEKGELRLAGRVRIGVFRVQPLLHGEAVVRLDSLEQVIQALMNNPCPDRGPVLGQRDGNRFG